MGEISIPDSRPKPFVLVLMPFDKAFDDVYCYGIRGACEKLGLHCERVDEQNFDGTILDRIYNQIAKADIIVADVTGRNANVFYETGYAHALGKRVILLTQTKDDIPFDLVLHPHIIYEGRVVELEPALEKRLQWMVDNPLDSLNRVDLPLEFFIGSIKVADGALIARPEWNVGRIDFPLSIHNAGNRVIETRDLQMALISPGSFGGMEGVHSIALPDGTRLHNPGDLPRIFPDGWVKITISVQQRDEVLKGEEYRFQLRVYTEIGARDYPMRVVIE